MSVMINGKCPAEPLDFTKHADRRARQRGLRDRDVELVVECGTPIAGDGTVPRNSDASPLPWPESSVSLGVPIPSVTRIRNREESRAVFVVDMSGLRARGLPQASSCSHQA